MKISPNFLVQEFFTNPDPVKDQLLKQRMNSVGLDRAKWHIDYRLPIILEAIRSVFNKPIKITSGWRDDANNLGSMHNYGRAVDFVIEGINPIETRLWIAQNIKTVKGLELIRGIEDFEAMNWVHIDVRNSEKVVLFSNGINTVTPKIKGLIDKL